jgi:hypothetical protein
VAQHTGVPPKHTKQLQPFSQHFEQQSQQACRQAAACLSPLVQVMQQPSLVYSHLQLLLANVQLQH